MHVKEINKATNGKARLVNIHTSEPLGLVCLITSLLRHQNVDTNTFWPSLTISQIIIMLPYQLKIKPQKQLLKSLTTILYFTMDFPNVYTKIKALALN